MKPVATRAIRKTEERPHTGVVTIKMDDPFYNYWRGIESILKEIVKGQLTTLRILINKSVYNSELYSDDRSLQLNTVKLEASSFNYFMTSEQIVFREMHESDKYDIFECSLDETVL